MLKFSDDTDDDKISLKEIAILGWRLVCLFVMAVFLPQFYSEFITQTFMFYLRGGVFNTDLPYWCFFGVFYLAAGGYAAKHFPKRSYLTAGFFMLLSLTWVISPLTLILVLIGSEDPQALADIPSHFVQRLLPLPLILLGVPAATWFDSPKVRLVLRLLTALAWFLLGLMNLDQFLEIQVYLVPLVGYSHPDFQGLKGWSVFNGALSVFAFSRALVLLRGDRPIGRKQRPARAKNDRENGEAGTTLRA